VLDMAVCIAHAVQVSAGLMKDGTLSLVQVASMFGFESYSSFAATFKAHHHVSPAHFRVGL
jgi:transcriptional regulator GlxA family with amidase domain